MISVAQPSYLHLIVGEWTYGLAGSNVLNEKDDYLFAPSWMHGNAGSEMGQSGRCPNRQLSKSDWEKHMQQKVTELNSDQKLVSLQHIIRVEQVNAEN